MADSMYMTFMNFDSGDLKFASFVIAGNDDNALRRAEIATLDQYHKAARTTMVVKLPDGFDQIMASALIASDKYLRCVPSVLASLKRGFYGIFPLDVFETVLDTVD